MSGVHGRRTTGLSTAELTGIVAGAVAVIFTLSVIIFFSYVIRQQRARVQNEPARARRRAVRTDSLATLPANMDAESDVSGAESFRSSIPKDLCGTKTEQNRHISVITMR